MWLWSGATPANNLMAQSSGRYWSLLALVLQNTSYSLYSGGVSNWTWVSGPSMEVEATLMERMRRHLVRTVWGPVFNLLFFPGNLWVVGLNPWKAQHHWELSYDVTRRENVLLIQGTSLKTLVRVNILSPMGLSSRAWTFSGWNDSCSFSARCLWSSQLHQSWSVLSELVLQN